jgi:hypothetical protein
VLADVSSWLRWLRMFLVELDQELLELVLLLPRWLSLHLLGAWLAPPSFPCTSLVLGLLLAAD